MIIFNNISHPSNHIKNSIPRIRRGPKKTLLLSTGLCELLKLTKENNKISFCHDDENNEVYIFSDKDGIPCRLMRKKDRDRPNFMMYRAEIVSKLLDPFGKGLERYSILISSQPVEIKGVSKKAFAILTASIEE